MVSFENFLGQCNHVLYLDVEAVADSLEENVGDVKVNNKNISIQGCLDLKVFVLGEECKKEVS